MSSELKVRNLKHLLEKKSFKKNREVLFSLIITFLF